MWPGLKWQAHGVGVCVKQLLHQQRFSALASDIVLEYSDLHILSLQDESIWSAVKFATCAHCTVNVMATSYLCLVVETKTSAGKTRVQVWNLLKLQVATYACVRVDLWKKTSPMAILTFKTGKKYCVNDCGELLEVEEGCDVRVNELQNVGLQNYSAESMSSCRFV